jgi:YVTN family beta-propeller protein
MAFSERPAGIRRLGVMAAVAALLPLGLVPGTAGEMASASVTGGVVSIGLPGIARGVAVDPATDTAYVTVPGTGVAVIDLATYKVTATIAVGTSPSSIAVDQDSDMVYVTNSRDDSVSVINGATNSVAATITGLTNQRAISVYGIAVNPVTNMIYAGIENGGGLSSIAVISGHTNTVTDTITGSGGFPDSIAVDPATDTVYLACGNFMPWTILVINAATNSVTKTISQASTPEAIAVDPATDAYYVANYGETVTAYNGATDTVTGTANIGGLSFGLAVNAATDTVYAAPSVDASNISLISGADNAVTGTIPIAVPDFVAVDPVTDTLVATDLRSVEVATLQSPTITSGAAATFTTGHAGSFAITGGGTPIPAFSESGKLPAGVTLSRNGTLAGTPARGTGGTYKITITAANGVTPDATQAFTLTVHQAPAITSPGTAAFRHRVAHTFTVRTTGSPTAKVTEKGALPPGLRFVAGHNGTAVITGKPANSDRGKQYVIRLSASNGVSPEAAQRLTIKVS